MKQKIFYIALFILIPFQSHLQEAKDTVTRNVNETLAISIKTGTILTFSDIELSTRVKLNESDRFKHYVNVSAGRFVNFAIFEVTDWFPGIYTGSKYSVSYLRLKPKRHGHTNFINIGIQLSFTQDRNNNNLNKEIWPNFKDKYNFLPKFEIGKEFNFKQNRFVFQTSLGFPTLVNIGFAYLI